MVSSLLLISLGLLAVFSSTQATSAAVYFDDKADEWVVLTIQFDEAKKTRVVQGNFTKVNDHVTDVYDYQNKVVAIKDHTQGVCFVDTFDNLKIEDDTYEKAKAKFGEEKTYFLQKPRDIDRKLLEPAVPEKKLKELGDAIHAHCKDMPTYLLTDMSEDEAKDARRKRFASMFGKGDNAMCPGGDCSLLVHLN